MKNIQKKYIEEIFKKKQTDKITSRHRKIIKLINKWIENGDKKILDIGIWDGLILRNIDKSFEKFGVDISNQQEQNLAKYGIKLFIADIENDRLPFDDKFFDCVLLTEVIEHVINTDHLLSEINRILKNDRFLILSFPNVNYIIGVLMQIFFDWPPAFSSRYKALHIRDWTKRIILVALRNNGFECKKIIGTRFSSNLILCCIKKTTPKNMPVFAGNVKDILS